MQEEILWLAEAAHSAVISAKQVLEQLVSKGTPARSCSAYLFNRSADKP